MTTLSSYEVISTAQNIADEIGKRWDPKLETILNFLLSHPSFYPSRSAKGNTSLHFLTRKNLLSYVGKYYREREGNLELKATLTVPDPAVDQVIAIFKNRSAEDIENIREAHRLSMAAENLIGQLLERYVASYLELKGWVWCCGSTVRAVDFLKQDRDIYKLLQVKNRDNSENSSSSAIREGRDIQIAHWCRSSSKKNATFWHNFPDNNPSDQNRLSEEGFFKFIKECAPKMEIDAPSEHLLKGEE